jgi:hypothetical protein
VASQVLPEHKGLIQQRLLGELTTALSGKPFLPPGSALGRRNKRRPLNATGASNRAAALPLALPPALPNAHAAPAPLVLLSLKTLASFRMEGVCLLPFVRDCVVGYLRHPHPRVRLEATVAATRLLADPTALALQSGPSAQVVQAVLETLLQTALADPEPTLRLRLFHELDCATFDGWLQQPAHLALLLKFLCDEDLRVRVAALRLLGRLAPRNPACALPPLRLTLTRLIADLQLQADVTGKEEATRMLCEFLTAEALRPLVQPLARALVHALPLYGSASARLSTAALDAAGELCLVMGVDMAPYSRYLMPVILATLQDASSTLRREVALRALGRLVAATGAAVRPYLEYPELLPCILQVVREGGSSQPWSLKRELLRTLGLLGALDPYKFDALQAHADASSALLPGHHLASAAPSRRPAAFLGAPLFQLDASVAGLPSPPLAAGAAPAASGRSSSASLPPSSVAAGGGGLQLRLLDEGYSDAPAHTIMYEQSAMVAQPSAPGDGSEALRLTPASEDYNPKVAVGALMKILRDPSLSGHHALVTQAVMHIFQNLGLKCVPFLNEIVPHMLHAAGSATEATMRESLLQQLAALTRIIKVRYTPLRFVDIFFCCCCASPFFKILVFCCLLPLPFTTPPSSCRRCICIRFCRGCSTWSAPIGRGTRSRSWRWSRSWPRACATSFARTCPGSCRSCSRASSRPPPKPPPTTMTTTTPPTTTTTPPGRPGGLSWAGRWPGARRGKAARGRSSWCCAPWCGSGRCSGRTPTWCSPRSPSWWTPSPTNWATKRGSWCAAPTGRSARWRRWRTCATTRACRRTPPWASRRGSPGAWFGSSTGQGRQPS